MERVFLFERFFGVISAMDKKQLKKLARLVRYYILIATTAAGSGHPSSSLSSADLLTVLLFGGFFRANTKYPDAPNNDRLIFSKGHAAPLLYALYAAAGVIEEEELLTLRKQGGRLEGHPTMRFPYAEAATGSLGQGLSIGVGMAMDAKYRENAAYKTFVLLGDSEMAEGSVWEAMELAAYYELSNLVAIVDVNRLGQRGETMLGHDVHTYKKRAEAFGWQAVVVDGHTVAAIAKAYQKAQQAKKPVMIVAKTVKGKGVEIMENKNGWHGKALSESELKQALATLGDIDEELRGTIAEPREHKAQKANAKKRTTTSRMYTKGEYVATRAAYGDALVSLGEQYTELVVLDAETSNSTHADAFKKAHPKRFFEMFIAEQNMVASAVGMVRRGALPFVSTFAAFLTRAADQIRMAQYSDVHIVFVGSHAGVSIGEDGASQMGLEELSLFRAIHGSTVLYPSDAVSTQALAALAAKEQGIVYLQTTRMATPVLYTQKDTFRVGGSQVLKKSSSDVMTVLAAGVTVHEALKAYEMLQKKGIAIRVVDMYSVKPIDTAVIQKACAETNALVVVEDHRPEGGLYEAVCGSGAVTRPVYSLAVRDIPHSSTPAQSLKAAGIDAESIVRLVEKKMRV